MLSVAVSTPVRRYPCTWKTCPAVPYWICHGVDILDQAHLLQNSDLDWLGIVRPLFILPLSALMLFTRDSSSSGSALLFLLDEANIVFDVLQLRLSGRPCAARCSACWGCGRTENCHLAWFVCWLECWLVEHGFLKLFETRLQIM